MSDFLQTSQFTLNLLLRLVAQPLFLTKRFDTPDFQPLCHLSLLQIDFALQFLADVDYGLVNLFQMHVQLRVCRLQLQFLLLGFVLFFLPLLAQLVQVVVDGEASLCELYARALVSFFGVRAQVVDFAVVHFNVTLQILNSVSYLFHRGDPAEDFLLPAKLLEEALLLVVEDLLEVAVNVFALVLLELLLDELHAPEASLHLLHHRVDLVCHL